MAQCMNSGCFFEYVAMLWSAHHCVHGTSCFCTLSTSAFMHWAIPTCARFLFRNLFMETCFCLIIRVKTNSLRLATACSAPPIKFSLAMASVWHVLVSSPVYHCAPLMCGHCMKNKVAVLVGALWLPSYRLPIIHATVNTPVLRVKNQHKGLSCTAAADEPTTALLY